MDDVKFGGGLLGHLNRGSTFEIGQTEVIPVAVVDKVVDQRGTRAVAEAYLQYLYSEEGQRIAARNFYRPRDAKVAAEFQGKFAAIELFTIDEVFGGWQKAQKTHFADKGVFDQIQAGK